jgi:hypothetical protein
LVNRIQAIYFDFGHVIGFPVSGLERKYLYLDWDGIKGIVGDSDLSQYLFSNVRQQQLEDFFREKIYDVFVQHENTDLIDPQSNKLLLEKLHLVFSCQVNEHLINRILAYIDTMKYIEIF